VTKGLVRFIDRQTRLQLLGFSLATAQAAWLPASKHAQRNPDGSVTVASARTHTPFVMYTVGVQRRFGGRN